MLLVAIVFIAVFLGVGFAIGGLARLLMPGPDPMGFFGTVALGVAGSLIGSLLQNLIEFHNMDFHHFHPVGIIGCVVGAWVLLLLLRLTRQRSGYRRY